MSRRGGLEPDRLLEPVVEWAGAILVNKRGELLLNLRDSSKALFPGLWDLIGGTLEAGETAEECMLREIAEETGVVLDAVGFRQTLNVPLCNGQFGRLHVFVGELDREASQLLLGEGEEHRFFTPSALDSVAIVPGTREVLRDFLSSPQVVTGVVDGSAGAGAASSPFREAGDTETHPSVPGLKVEDSPR